MVRSVTNEYEVCRWLGRSPIEVVWGEVGRIGVKTFWEDQEWVC